MQLETMTVTQLTSLLDDLDRQRLALRAQARQVKAALTARLQAAQAERWGLTPEQYAGAKGQARAKGQALHVALQQASQRALKELRRAQTAQAGVADVGTQATALQGGS